MPDQGQQDSRLQFLDDKVDYVVTDSPLLLALLYASGRHSKRWFFEAAVGAFRGYHNANFFIDRTKPYVSIGRSQTASEAREIDARTQAMLGNLGEPFHTITGDREAPYRIYNMIKAQEDLEESMT